MQDTQYERCRANKKDAVKGVAEPGKDDTETHTFTFTLQETSENLKKTRETRRRHDEDPSLLVDTGATSHIITERSKFVSFDDNFDTNTHIIELADRSKTSVVLGKGNAKVKLFDVKGNLHEVMLSNALYVPSYQQNIFSVSVEVKKGSNVNLGPQVSIYTTEEGREFEIKRKGRLYYLNSISSSTNNARTIHEWHRILGHCNYGDIRKLEKVVKGIKITNHRETDCEICTTQGKMCQFRNRNPDQRASSSLEFVHCDLAGPIEAMAKDRYRFKYSLSFVDDYTGTIKHDS